MVVMSNCLGPQKECLKLWKTQNAEMKNQGSTAFVKFKQILTSSSITYKQVSGKTMESFNKLINMQK